MSTAQEDIQMDEQIQELQHALNLSAQLLDEIMPQAAKLVFQDYGKLNEALVAQTKLRTDL